MQLKEPATGTLITEENYKDFPGIYYTFGTNDTELLDETVDLLIGTNVFYQDDWGDIQERLEYTMHFIEVLERSVTESNATAEDVHLMLTKTEYGNAPWDPGIIEVFNSDTEFVSAFVERGEREGISVSPDDEPENIADDFDLGFYKEPNGRILVAFM